MEQSSQFIEEEALTDDILVSEYDILYESTFALEETSPFTIRIITAERNWYSYQIDSLSSINSIIPNGDKSKKHHAVKGRFYSKGKTKIREIKNV